MYYFFKQFGEISNFFALIKCDVRCIIIALLVMFFKISSSTVFAFAEQSQLMFKFLWGNKMEDFKRIGYKNPFSAWVLLIGSVIFFILTILALIVRPSNFYYAVCFFLLFAIVFSVSFIIEKKRPTVVVFMSNNSIKILKGSEWKIILFDDIYYIDYKLNVFRKTDAILMGAGDLIIKDKTEKFVVRNIEFVRDCYEKIVEALKKYDNTEEKKD